MRPGRETLVVLGVLGVVAAVVAGMAAWVFREMLAGPSTPILWAMYAGTDFVIAIALVALIAATQRRNVLGVALAVIVPCALLLASTAKLLVLGTPARLRDAVLLPDLLATLPAWQWWLVVASAAAMLVLFAWNLARSRQALLVLVPVALLCVALIPGLRVGNAVALSTNWLPPRVSSFPALGHFLEAAFSEIEESELARWARDASASGGGDEALGARFRAWGGAPLARRDVHVVLVESLMDPRSLPAISWPQEPLSGLFAQWRRDSGSTAVSPVFGSRSSNAEFEVLCGLPAGESASTMVFAQVREGSALDCLPRLLAAQGFRTLSLVPSSPAIFNAGRAFPAMGFDRSLFQNDLDMSDRDGVWLSADATLRQTRNAIAEARARHPDAPVFSYTFVNAGHFPFERNRARRPDAFVPLPDEAAVREWANAAHYNALAIETHVRDLREADPTALIVILGDHQPPLGQNFHGYRIGGRFANGSSAPPLRQASMYETPLLILDGGTVARTGRTPTWMVPEIILDLLSGRTFCDAVRCDHRQAWRLRPFHDTVLRIEAHGPGETICDLRGQAGPGTDPSCVDAVLQARRARGALLRMLGIGAT